MKRGEWFTLKLGDDWGARYFSRAPLNSRGYAEARRAYLLKAGDAVTVRLRDGTERHGLIELVHVRQTVGDMGQDYDVHSDVPRVAFQDGTFAELNSVELKYEPERDPTAGEI